MSLTNGQKRAVAAKLIETAGDLVADWEERFESQGEKPPCNAVEARELLAKWLQKLPGTAWDTRLGEIE